MHRRIAALLQGEGAELDAIAGHLLLSEPTGAPETIEMYRSPRSANALGLGAPGTAARYLERAIAEAHEKNCEREFGWKQVQRTSSHENR